MKPVYNPTAKLNPVLDNLHKATTPTHKRPDHPDFMTSVELAKSEFTGMRQNNLAQQWEFWIAGEMRKSVSFEKVAADKFALTKAHLELFQFKPVRGIVD